MPNELLFGRVGYLYALLFIVKHIGPKTVDQSLINNVSVQLYFTTIKCVSHEIKTVSQCLKQ